MAPRPADRPRDPAARLPREFFAGPSLQVAPRLLGCVLEHQTAEGLVAVELTEDEAYEGSRGPGLALLPGPHRA